MDLSSINKIEQNTGFSKSESFRMGIVCGVYDWDYALYAF